MKHYPIINNEKNYYFLWYNYIVDLNNRINGLIDFYNWQKPALYLKPTVEFSNKNDPKDQSVVYYKKLEGEEKSVYVYNANSISFKEGFRVLQNPAYIYYGTNFADVTYASIQRWISGYEVDSRDYFIGFGAKEIIIKESDTIYILGSKGTVSIIRPVTSGTVVYKITQKENQPDNMFKNRAFDSDFLLLSTSEARYYNFIGIGENAIQSNRVTGLSDSLVSYINFKTYYARWTSISEELSKGIFYNTTFTNKNIASGVVDGGHFEWNNDEPIDCYVIYQNNNTYELAYCEERVHTNFIKGSGESTINVTIPTVTQTPEGSLRLMQGTVKIIFI